ncbi:MAG: PAS domain S-box protein [Desulfobulbus sp.]
MNPRREIFKIVIIYAVFGALWIYLSDRIVGWIIHDPEVITQFSMLKGWAFIGITSLLLYLLIVHFTKKIRQSAIALHESEARLKFLVDHSSDSFVIVNADGSQRYVSPGAEKITGFPVSELEGKSLDTILHPDDMPLIRAAWNEAIENPQKTVTVQYRHVHKNGGWVYSEAVAQSFFDDPEIKGLLAAVRDISQRKQAEEALCRKDALLQAMLRNLPFDFWARDSGQRIIMQSDESVKTWGDLLAFPENDWKFDKKTVENWKNCNQRALEGKVVVEECLLTTINGEERVYHTIVAPIRDDEDVLGILGINIDITSLKQAELERKALQSQLVHSQKMEAIGTLAGGIAHDFNNILAAIYGYAEMAKNSAPANSRTIHEIERVLEASERAAALIKQILAFSRQDKVACVPLEPVHLVKEAIKLLRSVLPTTIEIKQKLSESTSSILGDPTQIHQIVMNLCTNAFHAMEKSGGILSVSLRNCQMKDVELQQYPHVHPGLFVQFSVIDTGSGISPEICNKIFDPYFTTKETGKGTGMGLAIVHGIVTNMGGFVSCESKEGKGSVFNVYFPAIEEKAHQKSIAEQDDFIGDGNILFVDDEPILTELGQELFKSFGYEVTISSNGIDALELFKNDPHFFSAIITDQTMPGIHGIDFARMALKIRPDIPIILCTGFSSIVDEEQLKQSGIKGLVMKPYKRKDFAKILKKIFGAQHGAAHLKTGKVEI